MKVLSYGYRYGEVKLPKISKWKPSLRITDPMPSDGAIRPAIGESLGCHFRGALMPGPCPNHSDTKVAGVLKRFATLTPNPERQVFAELLDFARWYVKTQFTPIRSDADVSVEAWLLKCPNYTQKRKAELLDKHYRMVGRLTRKNTMVKSFIKDERYPEYKHARSINSRADEFKTLVGPIFRLMEEIFFKHPDFIKKIPVADRPQALFDKLASLELEVQCMDFKAMESHFTRITFQLEFILYDYLTCVLPSGPEFMRDVKTVLPGTNLCHFKDFSLMIEAARMSGEMNTSLGNGFVNWIISKFFAYKNGCLEYHRAYFEGDDSIVVSPYVPTVDDYKKIGFQVEMNTQPSVETASFCGLIFDSEDRANITDPMAEIVTFGWTNKRYVGSKRGTLLSLLRCKSLSMVYQYAGCPMLAALGRYGLRVTKHVDTRKVSESFSLWEKEQLEDAYACYRSEKFSSVLNRPVGMRTRLLMQRVYGLLIEDQIRFEQEMDAKNDLSPMNMPFLMKYAHQDWIHYWDNYVIEFTNFDMEFYRRPPKKWGTLGNHVKEWTEDLFIRRANLGRPPESTPA